MAFDPKQVGNQLIIVGSKQVSTGRLLKAYATKTKTVGITLQKDKKISKSMKSIENGIRSVRDLLEFVAKAFRSVAGFLLKIKVPNIKFKTAKVLKITVVVGISIMWESLFERTADSMNEAADDITNIRKSLLTVADNMSNIREQIPTIAENILSGSTDMKNAGQNLVDGGNAMIAAGNLLKAV